MMVTLVSQCEKKALNRTRRVLDAFANRIGSRTWQTVITAEGLQAVKKLLRKTATKNTAVSCHWIRSRSRSELLWVVGNKGKFNGEGMVPVNYTEQDLIKTRNEEDWSFLPIVQSLTIFAALLHDFGKLSVLFQDKLRGKSKFKGDPIRHEWISLLFLNALAEGKSDEEWLSKLMSDEIHQTIERLRIQNSEKPLANLPPVASLLAWLIVSHHRLPLFDRGKAKPISFKGLLNSITRQWGYENHKIEFKDWFKITELPSKSIEWQQQIKASAIKLSDHIKQISTLVEGDDCRSILLYSRLCLMLGDHYYSSCSKDKNWHSSTELYANTDGNHQLKQKLDEHLVGVAKQANENVKKLPQFEGVFNQAIRAKDKKALNKRSPKDFRWQDIAVSEIRKWKKKEQAIDKHQFGLFAVNVASTGKGKTYANAKIMQALSADGNSLRYVLALGLRTLTLQTGDEYREKIGLTNEELAVLIGSKAIIDLHQQEKRGARTGSESQDSLLDNELVFSKDFPEQGLDTVLRTQKDRQFLYAPVLTCTIDHVIQATEVIRGGRYILPTLRLMSSDLVIDEIDDFDDTDLIAIGRLIHLAGMLGRKVVISSATIPPDMAEGYFNAYQAGWKIFAKMRNKPTSIGCVWVDEFGTKAKTISNIGDYTKKHDKFISKRIKSLNQEVIKRKANIAPCSTNADEYFDAIKQAIMEKHKHHNFVDTKTGKTISIGVVRVANVDPCIELTKHLLAADMPEGSCIKTMAYHSRQVLLMRHEQEKYLDKILKRNGDHWEEDVLEDEVIRKHVDGINAKNVIFVLVATPVEEVGRDHDFDWAVIEPSSYRSFIQMAGRVLRHREKEVTEPNIAIMKYNLRALKTGGKKVAFRWPGYQRNLDDLSSYDLEKIVDTTELIERLDASNRVQKTNSSELADLEHKVIHELLTSYESKGPESLQGWIYSGWWLTGIPQTLVRFRNNTSMDKTLFLTIDDGFVEKNDKGKTVPVARDNIVREELSEEKSDNLWLMRDYERLLSNQAGKGDLEETALTYGEINLPLYGEELKNQQFVYNEQLGLATN